MGLLSLPEIREKGSRLKFYEVWQRRFLDKAYKDNSQKGIYRDYNFYSDGFGTYSQKDRCTYYYTFDGLPEELPIAYGDYFRETAREGVKISFISFLDPTKIEWDSPAIQSKLRVWKRNSEEAEDVDEFNFRENVKLLDNNTRRRKSLVYLSSAEIRRKRRLFKLRTMMIISGDRGTPFDDTVRDCETVAKNLGITCNRVTESMSLFLRGFSPGSAEMSSKVSQLVGNTVLPDEIIARFNTYDQGKIGEKGTYWGTDIYSGFPVLKVIKETTETAENFLFTAETGGGKSYFVKVIINQLEADPRFTGTIMDIEGFEYLPFAKFVGISSKVVVLNMAEGQGQYYDPVAIALTGNAELDKDMMSLSSGFTRSILQVLIGDYKEDESKRKWISSIISQTVSLTYANAGVTEEMHTWGNSRNLTLKDVYHTFLNLYEESVKYKYAVEAGDIKPDAKNNYKLNEEYISALDSAAASLRTYFEEFADGGVNAHVFKNRINLSDIVDAKLVVCSFGLAGKSEANIDETQLALTQTYAAIISQVRSLFAKAKGKFNYKVWEEFQRWGRMEGSEAALNTALTGGRKVGDVNIVVTNKVSEMLGANDKFGIFQNTTSFAIGAIGDANVRKELCKALSIEDIAFELDKLVIKHKRGASGVSTTKSIYDKGFLIKLDKSVVSLVKMDLPRELGQSDIFRTGINLVEEKENSNGNTI